MVNDRGKRYGVGMLPSDWIVLASVGVAALGIAATVFTQIWQSGQEERREARAAEERQPERWLNNNRDLYVSFLASADVTGSAIGRRFFLIAHRDYESLRAPMDQSEGVEGSVPRELDDLMNEMDLLAPPRVREAAVAYISELRALDWSTSTWSAQEDPAADERGTKNNEESAQTCRIARELLLDVMREDLRGGSVKASQESRSLPESDPPVVR